MNRHQLEAPFPPEQIRQREGNFGQTLDYIEAHAVIQRLNDALDGHWSFEVMEHQVNLESAEVIVLGKLTTGGIVKSQFGASRLTRDRSTGELVSLADDLKAAATDALKKTATLLGVGLSLYADSRGSGTQKPASPPPPAERLTGKQLQLILKLARENGLTRRGLDSHCQKAYGQAVEDLPRPSASCLIEALFAGNVRQDPEPGQLQAAKECR